MKNNKFKKAMPYLIILIASIIVSIPLLNKELNIYVDDGVQHICRLIGTWQTIVSKQCLPMIMTNLANGFGYSWNIFYSPLTAFAPLLLKIFNLSFVQILKTFMFIVTYISGITMYKCALRIVEKEEEKNEKIALLAAIFYIFAPYRLTDMYIRVALAELTSFIFIPIIFEGLYTIFHENRNSYMLAWGTIGLILTHTVVTMYTAILCFAYVICMIIVNRKEKELIKNAIINIVKNIAFAIIITSFFWVTLLEHYFATSYEVFVPGRMQRLDVLEAYKLKFYELFITTNNQNMIYEIGIITLIGIILTPIAYKKIDKKYKTTYLFFLIAGLVLLFMSLNIFPFEKLPSFLTMIQFTFRLLEFTAFFFAIIAAINYGTLIKKFGYKDFAILALIVVLLSSTYVSKLDFGCWYDEQELVNEPSRFTENTGRIHAGMASMEYMPSNMFNNKSYVANRKDEPIILNSEQTKIKYYEKDGTNMILELENAEPGTTIELPYTYYLGYRIYENNKEIKYVESDYGFVQITISDSDNVTIEVKYLGTNPMIISFVLSIIGGIVLIVLSKNKNVK